MKFVLVLLSVCIASLGFAEENCLFEVNPAFSTGVGVDPRAEGLVRYQYRIIPEKSFFIGPRAGVLLEQVGGAGLIGMSATQWLLSAAGAQLSVDYLLGFSGARSGYRVNPSMAVRLLHLGETGALAGEAGFQWDSRTLWGMRLGIVFEWGAIY